jgi:hypothetical protein
VFDRAALRRGKAQRAIVAARLERFRIDDDVRPVEGTGPSSDVEHDVLRPQPGDDRADVRFEHDGFRCLTIPASVASDAGTREAALT